MATVAEWFYAYKLAATAPGDHRTHRALVTLRVPYDPSGALYDFQGEKCTGEWLLDIVKTTTRRVLYPSHAIFACSSMHIVVENIEELDDYGNNTGKQLAIAYSIQRPAFRYHIGKCVDLLQRGSTKTFTYPKCVFFYLSQHRAIRHLVGLVDPIRYKEQFLVQYTRQGEIFTIFKKVIPLPGKEEWLNVTSDIANPAYSDPCTNPQLLDQTPYWAIVERACCTMVEAPLVRARYPRRARKRVKLI